MNTSSEYASHLDSQDELRDYRNKFLIPPFKGVDSIYLAGNSLGLQPQSTQAAIQQELHDWHTLGVEGHLHAKNAWLYYHHFSKEGLMHLCGANKNEVVAMNGLTVNLHLLLISFYQPSATRYKIVIEAGAFPSDQYIVETQIAYHKYNPSEAIIEVSPSQGYEITIDDIAKACEGQEQTIALFLFSGVQYYTGQYFDIASITEYAHNIGALAGFDLAHAIGNVPLQLHDWDVDFAAWCSYKYLNSGPGSVAGAFIHESHTRVIKQPVLGGWWGVDENTRFMMHKGFVPVASVDAWQHSNAPVLSMAALGTSLQLFQNAGIENLRTKSIALTNYFEYLLNHQTNNHFTIITPPNSMNRGCQLSLLYQFNGKKTHQKLSEEGIISDWREHNHTGDGEGIIRMAPVPLYNTYLDVWRAAAIINETS